jgi:hypothetical protein
LKCWNNICKMILRFASSDIKVYICDLMKNSVSKCINGLKLLYILICPINYLIK